MKKRFSVIIPAYNAEKVIERAIDSIKKQSFKDYEIIVVDDCSKDSTYEVLKKIDGIILKKTSSNGKEGAARNIGISSSEGEYIIFLDADDFLDNENVLKKLDKVIDKDEPDVVYMGFRTLGKEIEEEWIPTIENSTFRERARNWKYENVWDVCWNTQFLRKEKIIFEENRLHPDFSFYYEGILKAKSYKVANFVTHVYTILTNTSVTSSKVNPDKLKDLFYNIEKCLDMVKWCDEDKKSDFIYGIYRVSDYACRVLLKFEEETKEKDIV